MTTQGMIQVTTPVCPWCGKADELEVPTDGLNRWTRGGEYIQDAFPDLPAPIREQLISGTHPECWDALWAQYDED